MRRKSQERGFVSQNTNCSTGARSDGMPSLPPPATVLFSFCSFCYDCFISKAPRGFSTPPSRAVSPHELGSLILISFPFILFFISTWSLIAPSLGQLPQSTCELSLPHSPRDLSSNGFKTIPLCFAWPKINGATCVFKYSISPGSNSRWCTC